jgi:hypothetical protein
MDEAVASFNDHPAAKQSTNVLIQDVDENPYAIVKRINLAIHFAVQNYADLASGEAYMAILLCDELEDDCAEFHEQVLEKNNPDERETLATQA